MLTLPSLSSGNDTLAASECDGLRVIDLRPHHHCYHWNQSCDIDWPCEVRQYLVSISPLISVTRFLLSYGTLIIIILGLSLNIVSLYTLISSGLSKSGSGIYLVSLAICDNGNLIANYAVGIARAHIPGVNDIFTGSEWLCRWHAVFVEVFQLFSAWIVVSFTVERCLAIWHPLLLRHTSRHGRARKVLYWMGSILTIFSFSKLMLTGFEKDSVFGYAACHSNRYRWRGMVFVWIAFETWIPTLLVSTYNVLMFYKLRQVKLARKGLTEVVKRRRPPLERRGSFINRPSPTAPMLVAVSLAYLVLVFPLGVMQTIEIFWNVRNKRPVYVLGDVVGRANFIQWKNTKLLLKYLRSFCFALYQINFCINFFLYFAAGLQFRLHLQKKAKRFCGACFGGGGDGGSGIITPRTSTSAMSSRRSSHRQLGSGRRSHGQCDCGGMEPPPLSPRTVEAVEGEGEDDVFSYVGEVTIQSVVRYESEMGGGREDLEGTACRICMEALTPFTDESFLRMEELREDEELLEGESEIMDSLQVNRGGHLT